MRTVLEEKVKAKETAKGTACGGIGDHLSANGKTTKKKAKRKGENISLTSGSEATKKRGSGFKKKGRNTYAPRFHTPRRRKGTEEAIPRNQEPFNIKGELRHRNINEEIEKNHLECLIERVQRLGE